jgi:aldehyde dehydrogenase (NAD(P)+)
VTPYVIVPSKASWSRADLLYHARMAVVSSVLNTGHNCNATEVLVTAKGWPQREEFMMAVRHVLDSLSQRWPWYPGTQVRVVFAPCCDADINLFNASTV